MRTGTFLSALLVICAASAPSMAATTMQPVTPQSLNHFIGSVVYGHAHEDLGVVAAVSRERGLVGLVGKQGEFAVLDTSLLRRNGYRISAPSLGRAQVVKISQAHLENPRVVAVAKGQDVNRNGKKIPTIIIE